MSEQTTEQYDPADHDVKAVTEYLATADETERARVLAAESDGKARTTILNYVAPEPEQPTPEPEQQPAVDAPAEPDAAPAHVRPKRYTDSDGWKVGGPAPAQVVSRFDERTHTFGQPESGELQPGERGHIVVQAGDTVTASMLRQLRG